MRVQSRSGCSTAASAFAGLVVASTLGLFAGRQAGVVYRQLEVSFGQALSTTLSWSSYAILVSLLTFPSAELSF